MSKNSPKGSPQSNWPLLLVWALVSVLIFQWMNKQQPAGPPPDLAELHKLLVTQNSELREVSAGITYNSYTSAINEQQNIDKGLFDKKKITKEELNADIADLDAKRVEAAVLYADALVRGGEKTGRFDRFQDAYQNLFTLQQAQGTKPNWSTLAIKLPASVDSGPRTTTAAALFEKASDQLDAASKKNLVYGFIPGYAVIDFLVHITGGIPGFSYWFAAFLLAVLVRGLAWPLSQRQLMFTRQMGQLTPLVKEIQEKYKNNDTIKNQKTMELYGEYGINPAAGCLPAIVQIPFFLAIYQCMLQYKFAFQKGFFLWIIPNISAATHGFTAPNLGQKDSILILIYGGTMLISTLLMPVSDPTQAKQQRMTGVIVALFFPALMLSGAYPLPCAFVLYWTFTNVLTILQTRRAYSLPIPPLVKKTTSAGGLIPGGPRKQSFWEKLQEQAAAQLEESQRKAEETKAKLDDTSKKSEPGKKDDKSDGPDDAGGAPKSKPKPKKRT